MRKFCYIIYLTAVLAVLQACGNKPFSEQVVRSEMARCPEASYLDGLQGKLKWNYTTGLELKAFLDVAERYGRDDIFNYVEKWYDDIISEDGKIATYKLSNYSTDHICPGKTLFQLLDRTGKQKYRMAMDTLRKQLAGHPRTSEGGFWHKAIYPHQMWLDGLYMAQPYYAEYASRYESGAQRDSSFRDIMNHFLVVAHHTFDPSTGLYRHAWDESKQMFWCDSVTGQSEHAWGRALGWYVMAIVETLPYIPEGTRGREEVIGILQDIFKTLPEFADPATGMWFQVLDQPGREGNYTEATCNAMFAYALLKGTRLGYLPADMRRLAKKTYEKVISEFIRRDADGNVDLIRCCAVAGLGGKDNRSGNYDYYIHERICDNDPKGIGPLIWASLEMEK